MKLYRYIIHIMAYAFILCMAIACSRDKKKDTDLGNMQLKGKVNTLKVTTYNAYEKFGEPQKGEQEGDEIRYTFNEKGYKTEKCRYTPEGKLQSKKTYTYDERGRLAEKTTEHKEGSIRHEYFYEDGNLVKMLEYDTKGAFSIKYRYGYDEKGRNVEENTYKADGSHMGKKVYRYDRDGRRDEERTYLNDSESIYIQKSMKYNVRHHLVEEQVTHVEEKRHETNRSLISKVNYKYNDDGIKTEKKVFDPEKKIENLYTYSYTFDKKGNWIKKNIVKDGTPTLIMEREISYFK